MLTIVHGELFMSPARVLVNPVNTVGTMAGGVGEELRQVFPQMYTDYQHLCEADRLTLGQAMLYRTAHKWILNLPVRRHYRAAIRLDAVETSLRRIATLYAEKQFTSLSLPAFEMIETPTQYDALYDLLATYLGTLPIMVYVHLPADPSLPDSRHNITTLMRWLHGVPQHVSFDTFWRGIASIVRRAPHMQTLADGQPFSASFKRDEVNPRLMSLRLIQDEATTFIPTTLLRDLWQYVITAGYAHPNHLPGGHRPALYPARPARAGSASSCAGLNWVVGSPVRLLKRTKPSRSQCA